MIQKKKPDVDVILDVLEAAHTASPAAPFISSLLKQYQERGFLTKKQLEGLHSKAAKLNVVPTGKMATLEAIIAKMPTRYKSLPQFPKPLYQKNEEAGKLVRAILYKYPQHKRVLFLQNKYENFELISPADMAELEKFYKLLIKPG